MTRPATRRALLGNAVAIAGTSLLMGGIVVTMAEPETLPIIPARSDATAREMEFLLAYRSLPSDRARRAFLDNLLRYGEGETTFEDAALGFFTDSGLDPAEARARLDGVKAASPYAGWGDRMGCGL